MHTSTLDEGVLEDFTDDYRSHTNELLDLIRFKSYLRCPYCSGSGHSGVPSAYKKARHDGNVRSLPKQSLPQGWELYSPSYARNRKGAKLFRTAIKGRCPTVILLIRALRNIPKLKTVLTQVGNAVRATQARKAVFSQFVKGYGASGHWHPDQFQGDVLKEWTFMKEFQKKLQAMADNDELSAAPRLYSMKHDLGAKPVLEPAAIIAHVNSLAEEMGKV